MYICLGGRVIPFNYSLNDIPILLLSFLRIFVKVWKKIVRIQRRLLWGGVRRGSKIAWVIWYDVCKPKRFGC